MGPSTAGQVPEPLCTVLRDYLHVEWYELDELALDVKRPEWNQKVGAFKAQLREAIVGETLTVSTVEALTGQEFESQRQLVEWLRDVWASLYGESP